VPDDRDNGRWGSENISRRETEDSIPGIDQSVLPPIVRGEALMMRRAVVLDREPSIGVVEIGASQEPTEFIAKGNLAPRMRQSSENQYES